MYFIGTKKEFKKDKEIVKIATSIRETKETELLQNEHGFSLKGDLDNTDFISYVESALSVRTDTNSEYMIKALKEFIGKNKILLRDLSVLFCEQFKKFLLDKYAHNSASVFFVAFKGVITRLYKEELIKKNFCRGVTIQSHETKKEFLIESELKVLRANPHRNKNISNSFLFSCFTGLRKSDVLKLTNNQIHDGYIYFKQKKTKDHERIKLSKTALEILDEQKQNPFNSEKPFYFKSGEILKTEIPKWVKSCGINKHITFHCARHTFATLCLTNGVGIFTVSKLLGHKDIKTTLVYAKLISSVRDEAIDKLPVI